MDAKAPQSLLPTLLHRLKLEHTHSAISPDIIEEKSPDRGLQATEWQTRVVAVYTFEKEEVEQDAMLFERLLMALNDTDESVRAAALRALERWGTEVPIEPLLTALHDPSWLVREAAVLTLGRLREHVPVEELQASLNDENEFVHEAVGLVLGQWQFEATEGIIQDENPVGRPRGYAPTVYEAMLPMHGGTPPGRPQGYAPTIHEVAVEDILRGGDVNRNGSDVGGRQGKLPKRHLVVRVLEGSLAAVVVLGIIVSWFVLSHSFHGPGLGGHDSSLGPPIWMYHSDTNIVHQVNWTPDSKYLSYYPGASAVQVLQVATRKVSSYNLFTALDPSKGSVSALTNSGATASFSPNGQYAIAIDDNEATPILRIQVWVVATEEQVLDYTEPISPNWKQSSFGTWSDDSKHMAVSDSSGRIIVWTVGTQQPLLLEGIHANLNDLAWSHDGRYIAANTDDGRVEVWDITTKQRLMLGYAAPTVYALALSPDGKRLAVATSSKTIQVWDTASGTRSLTYADSMDKVYLGPQWVQDGRHIVSVNANTDGSQNIRIWDALSGKTLVDAPVAADIGWSLSPQLRYLAAADPDQSIVHVWDATTGREISTHMGGSVPSGNLPEWSPDGTYLATVRSDNAVQVWRISTGANAYTYQGGPETITQVIWSPDSKYLATLSTLMSPANNGSTSLKGSTIKVWLAP